MGLLAAAGFITGEALMGIGLAVPIAATGNKNVLTLFGGEYAEFKAPAIILIMVSLVLLYKLALRPAAKPAAKG